MQRCFRDVHAIDAQYGRAVPGVEEDAGLL